ncbi:hypothetical protein [Metabacillus endolithicus]|uniref:Uncharacterized protein n=1 Tax=Metabacillus endolithicus TaxID=1535204 RepID=A0ABW5C3Z8_9BACI|nr:hypothetical protein [Metabacillus endolithicus]UPG66255.1 hypothetical protein MVE64_26475 [Metabacillus endolithicus]
MSNKIRFSIFIVLLTFTLLCGLDGNPANAKEASEEKVKITKEFYIDKLEDGRVEVLDKVIKINEKQADKVLTEMGFSTEEINQITPEIKIDIAKNGGKKVETNTEEVSYSMYDPVSNSSYEIKGKSLDEVKEKATKKAKEINESRRKDKGNEAQTQSVGSTRVLAGGFDQTYNGWDRVDAEHDWKGQTYVIYNGRTSNGSELRYSVYNNFHWDSQPFANFNDEFAVWFNERGTKYAPNKDSLVSYTGSTSTVSRELTSKLKEDDLYGTTWEFSWSSPYVIYKVAGWGKQEVRLHSNEMHGRTYTVQGAHFHPHFPGGKSIDVGVGGITFGLAAGDKWKWTESFIVND